MRKNVASQTVGAQMVAVADGSAFTSAVTVHVTGDGGTQAAGSVGAGACTHEGNGYHSYAPAQAETNYDHVAFTFVGTGAIPATVQIYTSFPQTGDNFARIGAPVGASISADIAAVQSDTNDIQTRLPAALVSGRIDASVGAMAANVLTASALATDAVDEITAEVWTEASRTLTAIDEDTTTLDLDATIRTAVGLASANLDTQLDALPTAAEENATAVWAAGTRSLTILDEDSTTLDLDATIRTAVGLASANLDAQLTAIDDAVDTEVAAIKAVTDKLDTTLEATSDGYAFTANALENAPSGSGPSAATIADAVWDEALAGHAGAGSTGEALSAAGAAGDPWITALPGGYSAGQAGFIVGTNLNATVSSRASQTSVDDLPTNAELATALGTADDAVLAAIDALPTAVNADTLLDRDMSTGADSGSTTVRTPRQSLRILRNKWTIDSDGLQTITKEDDTTTSWTQQLATDASATPVVGTDPAGP